MRALLAGRIAVAGRVVDLDWRLDRSGWAAPLPPGFAAAGFALVADRGLGFDFAAARRVVAAFAGFRFAMFDGPSIRRPPVRVPGGRCDYGGPPREVQRPGDETAHSGFDRTDCEIFAARERRQAPLGARFARRS